MYIAIIITIWLLLGIHSCFFLIERLTLHEDFYINNLGMLVMCLFFPIASHIATAIVYTKNENENENKTIIFKKKE